MHHVGHSDGHQKVVLSIGAFRKQWGLKDIKYYDRGVVNNKSWCFDVCLVTSVGLGKALLCPKHIQHRPKDRCLSQAAVLMYVSMV